MSLDQTDLTDVGTEPLLYIPDEMLEYLGPPTVHSEICYGKFSW